MSEEISAAGERLVPDRRHEVVLNNPSSAASPSRDRDLPEAILNPAAGHHVLHRRAPGYSGPSGVRIRRSLGPRTKMVRPDVIRHVSRASATVPGRSGDADLSWHRGAGRLKSDY
jgi:hypothetical protein